MSSEVAVEASDLSKCYHIYERPQHRLLQMVWRGRKTFYREFWALKNVSLKIRRGSSVGILGRNGAGKSSLLQLIAGVLQPTSGQVTVHGRVAALLELGTGFNPEFSGRENVLLAGTILGLTREEIDQRLPAIEEFADIGDFIHRPVKTYSSGMYVRLAFAVAISVDPDILIIDEALAVGDVRFQSKCFRKFEEFRQSGKTIIFVTHSVELIVRHCDYAFLLDAGKLVAEGEAVTVANTYLDLVFGSGTNQRDREIVPISNTEQRVARTDSATPLKDLVLDHPGYNRSEYRWGNRFAEIYDLRIHAGASPLRTNHVQSEESLEVAVRVKFNQTIDRPIYGLTIKTPDGVTVYGNNTRDVLPTAPFVPQTKGSLTEVHFSIKPHLLSGSYLLSIGVAGQIGDEVVPLDRRYDVCELIVKNSSRAQGFADLQLRCNQTSPKEAAA